MSQFRRLRSALHAVFPGPENRARRLHIARLLRGASFPMPVDFFRQSAAWAWHDGERLAARRLRRLADLCAVE